MCFKTFHVWLCHWMSLTKSLTHVYFFICMRIMVLSLFENHLFLNCKQILYLLNHLGTPWKSSFKSPHRINLTMHTPLEYKFFSMKVAGSFKLKTSLELCTSVKSGITRGQSGREKVSLRSLVICYFHCEFMELHLSAKCIPDSWGWSAPVLFCFALLCSPVWIDSAVQKLKGRQASICVPIWNLYSQSHS